MSERDDPYWEQDAANDRDDWDQHVRHVEADERDRLTRDEGENTDPEGGRGTP